MALIHPMNGDTNISIDGNTIMNTTASNLYPIANKEVSLGNVSFIESYDIDSTLRESWLGAVATSKNVRVESVTGNKCTEGQIEIQGIEIEILRVLLRAWAYLLLNVRNMISQTGTLVPAVASKPESQS